ERSRRVFLGSRGGGEAQSAVGMQKQARGFGACRRPRGIALPGVGAGLERGGRPCGLCTLVMQPIGEEGCLDVLAECQGGILPELQRTEGRDGSTPRTVSPWAGDHQIHVGRITFAPRAENLPGSPGIRLVPEARHIEGGNRGAMQLLVPGLFLPEVIVIGMARRLVPGLNLAV